ncbi:MAG TPA: hypothetical protein VHA13_05270, partial [Gammaproteobacteria bacterium]|nr:hypothetical protein [Gammaproteobacteria bacterium]
MSAPRRLNVTTISVASSQPSSTAKFMTGFLSDSFVDNKDENQFAVLSNVASEKTLIELEKENLELKNIIKNMENELRQAEHRASLAENRTNFILHETRNYIAPVVAVVDVLDGSASTEEYKEDIKILKSHIDDSG